MPWPNGSPTAEQRAHLSRVQKGVHRPGRPRRWDDAALQRFADDYDRSGDTQAEVARRLGVSESIVHTACVLFSQRARKRREA